MTISKTRFFLVLGGLGLAWYLQGCAEIQRPSQSYDGRCRVFPRNSDGYVVCQGVR